MFYESFIMYKINEKEYNDVGIPKVNSEYPVNC